MLAYVCMYCELDHYNYRIEIINGLYSYRCPSWLDFGC